MLYWRASRNGDQDIELRCAEAWVAPIQSGVFPDCITCPWIWKCILVVVFDEQLCPNWKPDASLSSVLLTGRERWSTWNGYKIQGCKLNYGMWKHTRNAQLYVSSVSITLAKEPEVCLVGFLCSSSKRIALFTWRHSGGRSKKSVAQWSTVFDLDTLPITRSLNFDLVLLFLCFSLNFLTFDLILRYYSFILPFILLYLPISTIYLYK